MPTVLADLLAAHDEVLPLMRTVPDIALDWRPATEEFSFKQILVHLTHANDFYLMIVEEVRAANFGIVRLHEELPGWQRMGATDAEAWQCTTVPALCDCFERAYQRMFAILQVITAEELDRPFVLYSMQTNIEPLHTTLRRRVIEMAANHIHEHHAQLADILARWQTTQT
jgi:hypothetical protein